MIEQHIRRFTDGARHINEKDWEAYAALCSEVLLMRAPGLKGIATGREARIALLKGVVGAFPDGKVEVERSFGQGDWACIQAHFSGTHTRPLANPRGGEIPPTDRTVRLPWCMVVRFGASGDAVEIDEYFDRLDLLTQIGVVI